MAYGEYFIKGSDIRFKLSSYAEKLKIINSDENPIYDSQHP